jgi:hypothetical protein
MFCLSLSNACNEIAQCVNKSPFFSLCLDVSNDVTKTAQIIVCVRYFDVDENLFREKLLRLAYLTERPNAKNIYTAVKRGLVCLNVSTKNMCAITADGGPTMKSERNGVLSLFDKESDSDIFRLHYFVHQKVLVSKVKKKAMDDVKSIVKKAINSINTSSLKNNVGSLCDTVNEKHDVLLNYNHFRWLSFDLSVQRLCELYDQIITTLVPKYNDLAKQLQQNSIRGCILFLKDFLPIFSFKSPI